MPLDAEAAQAIAEITDRYRCRIHVFGADVGDESEVAALLDRIRAELPPLAGVDASGRHPDDALLAQQSVERFRTTLIPASGAQYLDRLTKRRRSGLLHRVPSVSSVFGLRPGQLLDGECTARRLWSPGAGRRACLPPASTSALGRRWMASSDAARANLGAQGLIPLEPSAALSALAAVVPTEPGHRHQRQLAAGRETVGRVPPADPGPGAAPPPVRSSATASCWKQLQEIPVPQRAAFVTEFPQQEVQHFLRLAQPPAATSRFLDLGTDS